jgi:acyl-coenzyme A thioesterase PaaI-like protein
MLTISRQTTGDTVTSPPGTADPAREAPAEADGVDTADDSAPGSPTAAAEARAEAAGRDGQEIAPPVRRRRTGRQRRAGHRLTLMDRLDNFVSRLSTRNNFWHRVCSLIWLPYAFRSGIRMKRIDAETFTAVLPFRRFNKNWYNAMAGAALLGNSEIAGGMWVFGQAGGRYTVVCKRLEYNFLRPCFGPAMYRITPREDMAALVTSGDEFNVTVDMEITQAITKPSAKERRVGRAAATFHVTPKAHQKRKGRSRRG